ncbi:MAG: TetR family transcriptional regulator C-terminal domain-containing protein [Planctomycetota bacterium]
MAATTAETRDRILEAGSQAIVAKSYNGCGLNEILSAAKVPKGSFYHYFKSKEGFGVAVIEQSADGHSANLRRYFTDRSHSPLDRVRAFYVMARDYYAEHGPTRQCLIAKLALETAQLSEPMRAAIKCGYDEWAVLHAKVIREAQAEGQIPPDADAEALANAVIHAWEGATIRMQIDQDIAPLNEFLDVVLERLLGAN